MAETVAVRLVMPATPNVTPPGLAVENGVEYLPAEQCPVCWAIVAQEHADAHLATHPPEVSNTPTA